MEECSEKPFRIAYFVDAFPRRTENFVLREIASVIARWPALRVYSFRETPENWAYVDCAETAGRIPQRSIRLPLLTLAGAHAQWLLAHPVRYARGLCRSLALHGLGVPRAARRFSQAVALAQIARSDCVEHLHAHFLAETAIVCSLAAGLLKIPLSVSVHANDIWGRRAPLAVLDAAVACVACTAEAKKHIERTRPGTRVELVRHVLPGAGAALDPAAELPPPPPLRLISAGRFVAKKGFDTLIRACGLLAEKGVNCQCEIVGEGPLEDSLRHLIADLSLADRVRLVRFCPFPELMRKFRQAHLFVLSSRVDLATGDRDGIPNTLLEAMRCRTVVVASRIPSVEEILIDRENAFLFEPDDPAALAEAARNALANQSRWSQIRETAAAVLKTRFSSERNARTLCDLIEDSSSRSRGER